MVRTEFGLTQSQSGFSKGGRRRDMASKGCCQHEDHIWAAKGTGDTGLPQERAWVWGPRV